MMDRPRHTDQLGVNKIGKKINKTPLPLPKNGFRSIVTKPQNSALRKIRPAAQVNRPCVPPPPAMSQPMMGHAQQLWSTIAAESPVSVCMSSLQSSSGDSGNQMQPSHQYQPHSTQDKPILPSPMLNDSPQVNGSLTSARTFNGGGILPTPVSVCIRSPQSSFGPNRNQTRPSHDYQQPQPHSPRFNGSASSVPILPSPRFSGRGILPTPPRTPRSYTSSTMAQGGILGPGNFPQPSHASPGLFLPPSPFGENSD